MIGNEVCILFLLVCFKGYGLCMNREILWIIIFG